MLDIIIIGCGIVGAATAYELSRYDLSVAILERENDIALGTTKANSAIVHAGYDPTPGTLMAKLDVEGAELAKGLFNKLDIPYRQCGALVLALSDEEAPTLHLLYNQAIENGVAEVRILTREEVLALEPHVSKDVVAALHAPTAMITDPWEYTLALAEIAVINGVELRLECEATGIDEVNGGYVVHTALGDMETRMVINAAGLYSDDVHKMVADCDFTIKPGKGEYWLLDKSEGTRVGNIIFQCPSKTGKGVLVTPTVHGNLLVGPGNILPEDRDDTSTTTDELDFVKRTAQRSIPSIDFGAVIRTFSGNRAQTDIDDFIIKTVKPRFVDLAGIKSPGLTAAPAIAKMAVSLLEDGAALFKEKKDFRDSRKHIRFAQLSPDEKAQLIEKDPLYGHVICRCETITVGEIRDTFNSPIPPRSIDAIKRRTNAGMGRCQGGFCGPRVLELISKQYGIDPTEVLQDRTGTRVLTAETKDKMHNA